MNVRRSIRASIDIELRNEQTPAVTARKKSEKVWYLLLFIVELIFEQCLIRIKFRDGFL